MPGERHQAGSLENERFFRILKNSQLYIYDEYKQMLRDIQAYLDEEKRSAFGGKKKRENDMRPYLYDTGDTYEKPFFSVLTKMLLEIVSMKNSQKQLEDLQKVYQWYITNKTQLCKADKTFGVMNVTSKPLSHRPSSSIEPGSKSGILRHTKSPRAGPRSHRPQTSYFPIERDRLSSPEMVSVQEIMDKALLNIKKINSVTPPHVPDNLDDYSKERVQAQRTPIKRPDTAPPYVVVDSISKVERRHAKVNKDEPSDDDGMQSPVSKVSIHYNSLGEQRKLVQVHQRVENNELRQVSNRPRSKSANALDHTVRICEVNCDLQSDVDEDRLIVDADQVVHQVEIEECRNREADLRESLSQESEEKFNDIEEFSHKARNSDDQVLATLKKDETLAMHFEGESHHQIGIDDYSIDVAGEKLDYIPSYSKFQKMKDRKKVTHNEEDGMRFESSSQAAGYSPRTIRQNVAKTHIDRQSGLKKQDLSTNALLEMVTPIGQQMLEQKAPMPISHELRREVRQSPTSSPRNSPRDRLSPRLYLRSNAGLKTDHSNQKLRNAEIVFPAESPRLYKVHFPKEKPVKTERHYKISGPVTPDSVRYQYTQDGFGNKTYLKKLTRPHNNSSSLSQAAPPQAMFHSKDQRTMKTKALASSMIIKHLGGADRRTSDRLSGQSGVVPMWIAAQDTENHDTTNYVKMTKSLEKDAGASSGFSDKKRSKYHTRHIDIDDPGNSQTPTINADGKNRFKDREPGNYSYPMYHTTEGTHADAYKLDWLNKYNGGYFPLKAEGRAVQVGEKFGEKSTQPSSTKQASTPQIQATIPSSSRPSSHLAEKSQTDSPPQSSIRPVSACSKASSRVGSARSRRSARSNVKSQEAVGSIFDVNQFSHYCFDDNPSLEDDYQLQKKINAAVDIQRIFRGYMARKYARDLKLAEKERQKKAAVMIQSSMRGFLARKRLMEEKLNSRAPHIDIDEWEKQYKEHLKKKDDERTTKAHARSRQLVKLQVKQDEKVRKVSASKTIHDIFHDKGPTKAQMKAAAITIQRYVRGWLVRKFFEKAKQKAMKRTLDFNGFLKSYKAHIERIMERHGVKNPQAVLAFDELLEYIEKRNKYEIEYDRIAKGKRKDQERVFTYEDIKMFFQACGHHPSRKEIEDAINLTIEDIVEMKKHNYTKAQIVEIAFQIYVPKGTKLTDTRKSTWLNPIIDGDEAAMMKLSKKINESTNLEKVFRLVSATKREQVEMEQRAITPDLLPLDAKLNGFEKLKEKPTEKGSPMKTKKK